MSTTCSCGSCSGAALRGTAPFELRRACTGMLAPGGNTATGTPCDEVNTCRRTIEVMRLGACGGTGSLAAFGGGRGLGCAVTAREGTVVCLVCNEGGSFSCPCSCSRFGLFWITAWQIWYERSRLTAPGGVDLLLLDRDPRPA